MICEYSSSITLTSQIEIHDIAIASTKINATLATTRLVILKILQYKSYSQRICDSVSSLLIYISISDITTSVLES